MATAAPGVREILTVGKLCWEVRERHYDLVVVDAPASGHIIGQLAAPQAINDLVKVGLIRSQTDWMLDILSDPRQTGLVAVCTPEEMPVSETLELATRVREETTVRMSAVVVNRVLPELFGQREEEVFEQLRQPDGRATCSRERAGGSVAPVLEAARLAVTMRRTRSAHLQRLQAGLPDGPARAAAALPVRAELRRPHDAPGGPRPSARSWACDRPAGGRAPPRRSASCSRPRTSSSPAGPAASARPPRRRPWPPWRPSSRAAGCWC